MVNYNFIFKPHFSGNVWSDWNFVCALSSRFVSMRFEKKANKVELRITKQPRRAGVKKTASNFTKRID